MIFRSQKKSTQVVLPQSCLDQMLELMKSFDKVETGGIIIGKYTNNNTIAEIIFICGPPPDSKHGRYSFERGIIGLKDMLASLWLDGYFYLGEWHTHPKASPSPSGTDLVQMIGISKAARYNCQEPILIILGGKPDKYNLFVAIFNKKGAYYQLDLQKED
jgi:integrative and conjugative element protein (TIGR02256 family)